MTRPMTIICDVNTGEMITREMDDNEYTQYLIDKAAGDEYIAKQAEEDAKIAAKQAAKAEALAALGLSQEIVNLLAE